jgi:glycine cleavage system T protein
MERARAVVVGGGITGCSVLYHLACAGWTDVVLLEKGELTSGSTCHAAGLVTQYNPSPTMMRFRRYSIELYRELGVFETVGGARLASSRDQLQELRRGASRARGIGLEVELLSPAETLERMPAASPESLHGSLWVEADGFVDPHTATYAVANAARELGARILTHRRLTGIARGRRGEVIAVHTDQGPIETEVVINAAGLWAPRVSAMVGAFTPSTPVDHQHIALHAVPGHELPRDMPCFRDPDNLVYGKAESGGILFGGYEPNPAARWIDGAPWEHGGRSLPPDEERFAQLFEGAARRFPFIRDAGVVTLVCHPDAMTPDANPLLGPLPAIPGFWVAAGLSLNGFGGAGGMGKAIAEWVTSDETEHDVTAYRPWRFGNVYRDPQYAAEVACETYRYYYRLRFPLDTDQLGRPRRLGALYSRTQDLGAVFGVKNGWERPEYFAPGEPWRRAGEDQRDFGWAPPPYLDRLAEEHAAVRERVGIFDLTSFGKIDVSGPGALDLLERVCDNRIDRPDGSVVYTQFLDHRGGIVADVTVTRLADERFRVVTGAGAVDGDLGWLRHHAGAEVEIREQSDDLAVIGMWGPHARAVLQGVTATDISNDALPFRTAQTLRVEGADLLAQRITYVGELGYELYVAPEWAVQVWDRLLEAGAAFDITPCGYRVLDTLRIEKGYRYLGTDLTAGDDPYEAGLEFCVAEEKEFIGSEALARRRTGGLSRRIRTLLVGEGYVTAYGGEAVMHDGQSVGRLRSCAYGFTIGRMIGYAYLPIALGPGSEVTVEVLGEQVEATVVDDVAYDPTHSRVRG